MQDRAVAARAVGELVGLALQQRGKLLVVLGRHPVRVDHQHDRRGTEIAIGVKSPGMSNGMRLEHAREDDHVVRHHAEREAVGRRARQRLQADDAAGTRLVVDDHRGAQRLGQRRLRGARDRIDPRAGGVGQDEFHRLVAGLLRERGCSAQRAQADRQQLAPGGSTRHRVSPEWESNRCGSSHRVGLDQGIDLARRRCRCRPAPRACARRAWVDSAARRGAGRRA